MTIPADAWPAGDTIEWFDDATRTHHDFFNETTRPYADDENAQADERAEADQADTNGKTLLEQIAGALVGNRAFLDLVAPTNAQSVAQVKALTRQMNAVVRLVIDDLSGTN